MFFILLSNNLISFSAGKVFDLNFICKKALGAILKTKTSLKATSFYL